MDVSASMDKRVDKRLTSPGKLFTMEAMGKNKQIVDIRKASEEFAQAINHHISSVSKTKHFCRIFALFLYLDWFHGCRSR